MSDKIALRKNFLINSAYIALVIVLSVLAVLSANMIMPFWFALMIAALLQPVIKTVNKKSRSQESMVSRDSVFILFAYWRCRCLRSS